MLHKIVVSNPKGEALELELSNPDKSGFTVAKVEGLGPPKANINGQEMANTDGMFFTSARSDVRQIIFTLEFRSRTSNSPYGELTIEQCRHLCYRHFPLKKQVTMTFYTDEQVLYTSGYVESNEPEIFSMQEYAVISVLCPDPWMYEIGNSHTVFSGVQPSFEFPFSNESPTEHKIQFGDIWLDSTASLEYKGTVDTGIVITVHANGTCEDITFYNMYTDEKIFIDTKKIQQITGTQFQKGDDIILSTVIGERYCKLVRNGIQEYNIIGALGKDVDWFQISNGDNLFGFSSELGANTISVTFAYQNAYMGV